MKSDYTQNKKDSSSPVSRIITYGLNQEQNVFIKNSLPSKECELLITDVPTDLIAVSSAALIINASVLNKSDCDMLFDYYTEIDGCTDESVFWIGSPLPPHHPCSKFKCFNDFEELSHGLKYLLLSASRKSRNAREFSKKMADCLLILSHIRSSPGIKTKTLADTLELPVRTVQRYIATLQAAGEWIEYDTRKRGWALQSGVSILFGDHIRDIEEAPSYEL